MKEVKKSLYSLLILCLFLIYLPFSVAQTRNPKKCYAMPMNHNPIPANFIYRTELMNPSWYYHWGDEFPEDNVYGQLPDSIGWSPMIWDFHWDWSTLDSEMSYLDSLKGVGEVNSLLGFNEPDQSSQANMTVHEAVVAWPTLMNLGVTLGSPAPSGPKSSWLYEFMDSIAVHNYRVDFVAVHWYAGASENTFINAIKYCYNRLHIPMWITEFAVADWKATTIQNNPYSSDTVLLFMKAVLPVLDALPYVQKYFWHNTPYNKPQDWSSALFDSTDSLTTLGQYYSQYQYNVPDQVDYQGPLQLNHDGVLEIFGVDGSGNVWRKWQITDSTPNSEATNWSAWSEFSGMKANGTNIAVARNTDKTLQVFVSGGSGTNGDVFYNRQKITGGWTGWTDIGGSGITYLRVADNADGSIQIFGLDSNGNVYHNSQTAPSSTSWIGWSEINGETIEGEFAVALSKNGRIVLAGVSTSSTHHVYTTWQQPGNLWNGGWEDTGNLGGNGTYRRLRFARDMDKRLELFGKGNNNDVWHIWQKQNQPDSVWSNWSDMGHNLKDGFVISRSPDGRLFIIGVDGGSSPHHIITHWQTAPNGGWTTNWADKGLPSGVTLNGVLMVGLNVDGRMQYFSEGSDGNVWTNWWLDPIYDNGWSNWGSNSNYGGSSITWSSMSTTGRGILKKLNEDIPQKFALLPSYPNPFNPSTNIRYDLPKGSQVTIRIFDITGRTITTLVNEKQSPGQYSVRFDGSQLASGMYIIRMSAGTYVTSEKILLVK